MSYACFPLYIIVMILLISISFKCLSTSVDLIIIIIEYIIFVKNYKFITVPEKNN